MHESRSFLSVTSCLSQYVIISWFHNSVLFLLCLGTPLGINTVRNKLLRIVGSLAPIHKRLKIPRTIKEVGVLWIVNNYYNNSYLGSTVISLSTVQLWNLNAVYCCGQGNICPVSKFWPFWNLFYFFKGVAENTEIKNQ